MRAENLAMSNPPRLLIITAAFGEGHNSAARNLALALTEAGVENQVCDPCLLATPVVTQVLSRLYRFATDYLPRVWEKIYYSIDRVDFNRSGTYMTRKPEALLAKLISDYQPSAIISTYPLYPYLLDRIFRRSGKRLPVLTVVTDSMEINSAWLRAPSDYWLVTDPATRESMIRSQLPAERIVDTGFPVNPAFSRLIPLDAADCCEPFRILFFPTARRKSLTAFGRAILDASPAVRLTLVLGKNVKLLHADARALQQAYPARVRIMGWTRRIPRLLNQHHLVVGKAGGATVHEAIAAHCPMLIHHLVPGQEEGNLRLLEAIGAGGLAADPLTLTTRIKAILANRAATWRAMKCALAGHNRNAGAIAAATFILETIQDLKTQDTSRKTQ
jgi:processive 1,2-diacylglycerol beta-glucosyltransferase